MDRDKVLKSSYSPFFGVRLLWWFGVYVIAQLPLIPWVWRYPAAWFNFPTGIAWPLFLLTERFIDWTHRFGSAASEYFVIALMVLPWIVYAAHLIFSLYVRKRRTFLILMWILGVIVLFNLGSCAYFIHAPPE
ncbi:MAG: hypothetical protein LV479_09395 [Methylacidiphilales bacterium]|nr:hypothetical protein [Candidatus Methylacidiphilales bacterium]